MRYLILVTMTIAFCMSLEAQEDSVVQLHFPTASEYLQVLQEIESESGNLSSQVSDVISIEVDSRYVQTNQLRFDDLYRFYTILLNPPYDRFALSNRFLSPWLQVLTELWLNEYDVSLELERFFHYDDLNITATPMKFRPEWETNTIYRLDVIMRYRHRESYFVREDAGHYQILDSPLSPFFVNADLFFIPSYTIPIWGFLQFTENSNLIHRGTFNLLTWRDEQLEVLLQIDYREDSYHQSFPVANSFSYINVDDDPSLEVRHFQELNDNWYCNFTRMTTYDYVEEQQQYEQSSDKDILSDDFGCLARQAEQAVWEHDYPTAIDFYEQALAHEHLSEYEQELKPFIQVRLALAYLLTGQENRTQVVVDVIPQGQLEFADVFVEAYQFNPEPLPLCQTIYDFVAQGMFDEPSIGTVEVYEGGFIQGRYNYPGFFIENVACDLETLIRQSLSDHTLSIDRNPLEHLASLGITVSDYLTADFDLDGESEWLIWTSRGIDAIFFHPRDNIYQISYLSGTPQIYSREADLRLPDEENRYDIISLPDELGQALVNIDFGSDNFTAARHPMAGGGPTIVCSRNFYDDEHLTLGDLSIWRMQGDTIEVLYFQEYCGSGQINELFSSNMQQLHAATVVEANPAEDWDKLVVIPAVYNWNSGTMLYELNMEGMATPNTAIATPAFVPISSDSQARYRSVTQAMIARDYDAVIQMTEASASSLSEESEFQDPYFRAVALEELGQYDKALAHYVAIYESSSGSVWGKLAALHLETTDR